MTRSLNALMKKSVFSRVRYAFLLSASVFAAGTGLSTAHAAELAQKLPAPALDQQNSQGATPEVAVLAGGCFWGVQGVFQHVKGVTNAVSGYAGGDKKTAHYEIVGFRLDRPCRIGRGHLRSSPDQLRAPPSAFLLGRPRPDPAQSPGSGCRHPISLRNLSEGRRAGAPCQSLHRSAQPGRDFHAAIVTKIEPDRSFYAAEGYHQDFLTLHPSYPYIVINDLPKVADLKHLFPDLYREQPVLVGRSSQSN